jgi:hypothetical protein
VVRALNALLLKVTRCHKYDICRGGKSTLNMGILIVLFMAIAISSYKEQLSSAEKEEEYTFGGIGLIVTEPDILANGITPEYTGKIRPESFPISKTEYEKICTEIVQKIKPSEKVRYLISQTDPWMKSIHVFSTSLPYRLIEKWFKYHFPEKIRAGNVRIYASQNPIEDGDGLVKIKPTIEGIDEEFVKKTIENLLENKGVLIPRNCVIYDGENTSFRI